LNFAIAKAKMGYQAMQQAFTLEEKKNFPL